MDMIYVWKSAKVLKYQRRMSFVGLSVGLSSLIPIGHTSYYNGLATLYIKLLLYKACLSSSIICGFPIMYARLEADVFKSKTLY